MELGVAYYPEHYPAEQWAVDYKRLNDAGIDCIRIAEFAWSSLEPNDGEYRWDWLDQAIELAAVYGIRVVLCTPTACPPIWLVEQYPEVLPVHKGGTTVGFGARQHRSYSSAKYIEYSLRIVTLMAERYGQHPNVAAWQLDNEFAGETKYDFGDCSKRAFHAYLANKFGTIEQLNQRWGTAFWSQHYHRFDQIPLPAPIQSDVRMWQHPSLELEFARFSSIVIVQFARAQVDILRAHIGDRPITTNAFMFKYGDSVDWIALFETLDVVGMDIYSNHPHEIAFYCDASRGVLSKPFWMMEYGSGAANLERDMDIIQSRDCSWFFLFKLKPFPWGQEQGRGAAELLTITGEPSHNYKVVQSYSNHGGNKDITKLPNNSAKVGLYYHFESSWSYQISVQDRLKYPESIVDLVYKSLYELDEKVDIVYTPQQITDYQLLIVPYHILYDARLEDRLVDFVNNGGKLIVTSDLFRKNEDNVFLTEVPRIFSVLFDWHANNFVTDSGDTSSVDVVIRSHISGKGQAWIVNRDLIGEQWQQLLKTVIV